VEDLQRDVLRAQFEVNLFGTHELTVEAIRIMRRQGHGRVIMNSSVLGLVSLPFRGAYAASKFALEGLTDTLRLELAGSGIHVSLIEPGPITSRFRANSMAKYKEHIDTEGSHFRDTYAGMEARLKKEGPAAPFTLGPEAVLEKVIHAIESRRPKARYYVTFPTYLFAYLRRFLSHSALDAFLLRISRGENSNR
jgi:NAD(P)-dependent dehydrogenase (short-subunit alcohol dehydrogenase family)